MVTQYKNLINGEMVANGQWLDVVNPANEQVIGQVPACGKDELDKAVAAARAAFTTWKKTSFEERQAVCMAISGAIDLLVSRPKWAKIALRFTSSTLTPAITRAARILWKVAVNPPLNPSRFTPLLSAVASATE